LFWRSNSETLSDQVTIFIEDSSLIFLQFERCDCLLEVCRSVKNFVKSCCPQDVLLTDNLSCFGNPTVKSSLIALKFLLTFYHSHFVVFDSRIWYWSCSIFPENSWTLSIFLVTRFLNFSLLISICWYFGPLLVTVWGLGRIILVCSVINFVRLIVPLFWYLWSIYRPVGFFYLYWEVFPTLIIAVDLFFCFRLHIGFVWIDWLHSECFNIVLIKVNLIASVAGLLSPFSFSYPLYKYFPNHIFWLSRIFSLISWENKILNFLILSHSILS